jgi:hypothetical protein
MVPLRRVLGPGYVDRGIPISPITGSGDGGIGKTGTLLMNQVQVSPISRTLLPLSPVVGGAVKTKLNKAPSVTVTLGLFSGIRPSLVSVTVRVVVPPPAGSVLGEAVIWVVVWG